MQTEKFITRFEKLPKSGKDSDGATWTIGIARYAKDKCSVAIHNNTSGWKTLAALVLTELNARWSGREKVYIVSLPQAEKFVVKMAKLAK